MIKLPLFLRESGSTLLLAACTVLALVLANGPASETYLQLLQAKWLGLSLQHWVNDGLMTIFFFAVGLEIKRELVVGELASPRRAALPIAAALGGMIGPAALYLWINTQAPAQRGWGIPMATDIAFAVAVLSFFGQRVPATLKIFLLALAIVDDLGAVLVIALFYTSEIRGPFLAMATAGVLALVVLRHLGVQRVWYYVMVGSVVWFAVLRSGIHATVAGVVIGLITPLQTKGASTWRPLDSLLHTLHPYVTWLIMPVFALANAGVQLEGGTSLASHPIFLGVALGLFVGKPLGIVLACVLAVKLRLAEAPRVGWGSITAVGCLGGVGFTMALFVSSLALAPAEELYSKSGILAGSLASGLLGALLLWIFLPKKEAAAPGSPMV